MPYRIAERYVGWGGSDCFGPNGRTIGVFRYYWLAVLYRWFHYGLAEPAWQGSFTWTIEVVENEKENSTGR